MALADDVLQGGEGLPVLTFGDHTIYESDLALLLPGRWLNDRLIGLYYDYLQEELKSVPNFVKFVNPDTVMMVKMLPENDIREDLSPLGLEDGELVLIPINNNTAVDKAGGSHWSLLTWVKSSKSFHSFDSAAPMNERAALKVAFKIAPLVYPSAPPSWVPPITIEPTPRQPNGSDCGVYVLAISHALAHTPSLGEVSRKLKQDVTPQYISQFRINFLSLIGRLKA